MEAGPAHRVSGFKGFMENPWLHIAVVVLLGLVAYSNSFDAPFYFDDLAFLENPQVRSLENLPDIFIRPEGKFASRPVMHATFALNFAVGGSDASGAHMDTTSFHVVNVALHLLNGLLLYALASMIGRLIGADERKTAYAAFFVSALFVLHPVQTEAVTYLVSRSMVLATAFYLLGMILFIKAVTAERRRVLYIVGLFVTSLAGMGSRENFATFPLVLVLFDLLILSRFSLRDVMRHYKAYIPVFLGLGYLVYLVFYGHTYDTLTEMPSSGLPHGDYATTQFNVHWTYIRMILFPFNQNIDYDYPVATSLFEFPTLMAFTGYLALLIGAIIFSRKRPLASFGVLWFLITLAPISFGVAFLDLRLDDVMFEHRLYLPAIGLMGVLGAGCVALPCMLRNRWARIAAASALVLVPVLLCSAAHARNALWSDHIAMWRDAALKSPRKARPHNNLGYAYFAKGMLDQAEVSFKNALAMDRFFTDAYYNLGYVYYRKNQFAKAAEYFEFTLQGKPQKAEAHLNLALAQVQLGQMKKAERHLKIAASLRPYAEAHYNLGVLYMKRGDREKARAEFMKALAINPGHVDSRRFLESVSRPGGQPPH